MEDGAGLVGHEFGIEALEETDADFVGGEIDVVADIDAHGATLAQVPVREVAEDRLVLVDMGGLVVAGMTPTQRMGKPSRVGPFGPLAMYGVALLAELKVTRRASMVRCI